MNLIEINAELKNKHREAVQCQDDINRILGINGVNAEPKNISTSLHTPLPPLSPEVEVDITSYKGGPLPSKPFVTKAQTKRTEG